LKPADATRAFQAVEGKGLRRRAVRGAGVTVLSQSLGFAVQMIATAVLARLLTPADFGLVAMVTTFSLLLMNCGLNGFTEAVIQRDTIDELLLTNVFWINAAVGLVLTIAFAAAGPLLAQFYGDPRVARVAVALSLTILCTTLSVQHLALLKRSMRFSVLSANDIVARSASVIVSIVLARAGWGYWALVAGAVAIPLSTAVGAWLLCPWIPGLPRRGVNTGPMIRFAVNTYGRFAANYCTWNLDNLLVGWQFGPQSLGFYKKAYDLFVLPVNQLSAPLTVVAVSALSRVTGDPAQYRRYFLRALSTMAFIGMGAGGALTLLGKDLILLLLGPGWETSGRIFTFFGPGIGIMLLYGTHGWIHLSIGRADRWLRWGIVELTVTGLCFLIGLAWGPVGIALAWVVSFWILTIPGLWYAGRPVSLRVGPMIGVVWRYLLASVLAAGASIAIVQALPVVQAASGMAGALTRMAVNASLFGMFYLTAVILLHRGCEPLWRFAELLRDMAPSTRVHPDRPAVLAARHAEQLAGPAPASGV
jgi:O-antigen/teichoic acid export membrane protein